MAEINLSLVDLQEIFRNAHKTAMEKLFSGNFEEEKEEEKLCLKPCPMCGNCDVRIETVCHGFGDYGPKISCSCGLSFSPYCGESEIIERWNDIERRNK